MVIGIIIAIFQKKARMKNINCILLLLLSGVIFAQSPDSENTGFRIDAVSKETPFYMKPLVAAAPSQTLVAKKLEKEVRVTFSQNKNPELISSEVNAQPLKGNVYSYSGSGSISGVKNIAYKKAQSESAHQLYCRSAAAGRAANQ